MSQEAMLPCFTCGKTLPNVAEHQDNQPYGGTEFRTEGHYGSTFWDSFEGEELVLTICDDCLRKGAERLAQHKRWLPVYCGSPHGRLLVGRQWVDRPMVSYTGNLDDTRGIVVEPEELGTKIHSRIEWSNDIEDLKAYAEEEL